jgi:hypothetical protein
MISGKVVMLGRVTVRELPALVQEKKAAGLVMARERLHRRGRSHENAERLLKLVQKLVSEKWDGAVSVSEF